MRTVSGATYLCGSVINFIALELGLELGFWGWDLELELDHANPVRAAGCECRGCLHGRSGEDVEFRRVSAYKKSIFLAIGCVHFCCLCCLLERQNTIFGKW